MKIHFFQKQNDELYISEFGYSALDCKKFVGPRIREDFILHFIIKGECVFCGKRAESGNVFLIPKCVLHEFIAEENYMHYWIAFGGSRAAELLERSEVSSVKNRIYDVRAPEYLSGLFEFAFARCSDTPAGERIAVGILISALSLLIIDGVKRENAGKEADYADRAASFIEKNSYRRITMKQVSDYVMISEKHLCRLFKRKFGIPPQRYLLKIRMERAKRLLLETDLLVKEVAASVGYSSQLEFTRMFRHFFSVSPSALRKTQVNG